MPARFVDDNHCREPRLACRNKAGEDRKVLVFRVTAGGEFPSRAGFAGDPVTGNARVVTGTARSYDLFQHAANGLRGVIGNDSLAPIRLIKTDQRNRTYESAAADCRVSLCELQRRYRNAVAVSERSLRDLPPVVVMRQEPRGLPGESAGRQFSEAEPGQRAPQLVRRERHRDLGRADVARPRQHRGQADPAEAFCILDAFRPDDHESRRRVDHAARTVASGLERRRNDQRLEARAWFENIGDRAITIAFR